jgi:membrane fusion protein (multidrug efflux system)
MSTATQTQQPTVTEDLLTIAKPQSKAPRRRKALLSLLAVVVVGLAIGTSLYIYTNGYEKTDDAQVDGHLNPVSSRIEGTIKAVYLDDNQEVQAGEPMVELDPSDDQITLKQTQAQYDQAVAQLGAAHPNLPITRISNLNNVTSQQAEVAGADASLAAARHDLDSSIAKLNESQAVSERAQADYLRYQSLFDNQVVARGTYEQYKATAMAQLQTVAANQANVESARKTVEQRLAQLAEQHSKLSQTENTAPLQLAIREADIKNQAANVEAIQAALDRSKLNLNYTHINAAVSGVVTQRSAEVGARVSKGQQLFMIVQTQDLWVTANFKETQLGRIHPGQHVRMYIDALREDFDGTVESMPGVTGSRTSVLPPENATGNYVKVIQRLPVRIRFDPNQKGLEKLRPGMSVEPKVMLD